MSNNMFMKDLGNGMRPCIRVMILGHDRTGWNYDEMPGLVGKVGYIRKDTYDNLKGDEPYYDGPNGPYPIEFDNGDVWYYYSNQFEVLPDEEKNKPILSEVIATNGKIELKSLGGTVEEQSG